MALLKRSGEGRGRDDWTVQRATRTRKEAALTWQSDNIEKNE